MPTIDEMDSVIKQVHLLAPASQEVDTVARKSLTEDDMDFAITCIRKQLPENIAIARVTPLLTIVFWSGDPRIKLLIDASLAELPEFLANEEVDIRKLALIKQKYLSMQNVMASEADRIKDEQTKSRI